VSLPRETLLDIIVRALDKDACTFIIGAGMSLRAGMPSTSSLVARIKSECGFEIVGTELSSVAEEYSATYGRAALNQLLVTAFSECKAIYPNIYDQICTLPLREVLTTNWDILLEESLRKSGRPYFPARTDTDVEGVNHSTISYVKLHGCITTPSSLVVTESDYDAYLSTHIKMCQLFQNLAMRNVLVFLGYSLRDDTFRRLLKNQLGVLQSPAHPVVFVDPTDAVGYEAVLNSHHLMHLQEAGEEFIARLGEDSKVMAKRYRRIQDRWDFRIPAPPQDLIGREDVQIKLRDLLNSCYSMSNWPLIVAGPSGIGKTSVMRAAAERLSSLGIESFVVDARALKDEVIMSRLRTLGNSGTIKRRTLVIVDHFEIILSDREVTSVLRDLCDRLGPSLGLVIVIRSEECTIQPLEANYSELARLLGPDSRRIDLEELKTDDVDNFLSVFESDFGDQMDEKTRHFITDFATGKPWLLKKLLYLCLRRPKLLRNLSSPHQLFFYDIEDLSEFDVSILRELAKAPGLTLDRLSSRLGRDVEAWVTKLLSERLLISRQERLFLYHDLFADFIRKTPLLESANAVAIALQPFYEGIRQMREIGDWEAVAELYHRILPVAAEKSESIAELVEDVLETASSMLRASEVFMFPAIFFVLLEILDKTSLFGERVANCAKEWNRAWEARKEMVLARTLGYFESIDAGEIEQHSIGRGLIWLLRAHDKRTSLTDMASEKAFIAWGERAGYNAHETCQVLSLLGALLIPKMRRHDSWLKYGLNFLLDPSSQAYGRKYVWPYPIGLSRERPSAYTTAWCLEAMFNCDPRVLVRKKGVAGSLEWIKNAQNDDGGWPRPGTSESHVRETAIVLKVLQDLDYRKMGDLRDCIGRGDTFILSIQMPTGAFGGSCLERDGNIFATAYAASYLSVRAVGGGEYREACLEALRWLSDSFDVDSGWVGNEPSFGQIEAAGILLSTLCRLGINDLVPLHAIRRYIVRNQLRDGSWPLFDQRERVSWGFIHPTVIAVRALLDCSNSSMNGH
jgi:hypothetical protein